MKVLCIGVGVVDIAAWPVSRQTEWQEKQRISGISIQAGGDAVNQAVYLSQLGMEACVNICVGRDENGVLLKEAIRKKGVDTSFIRVRDDAATGTALVLIDEKGERRVFSAPGAHGLIRKTDLPEEIPEHLQAVSLASLFGMDYLERDGLEEFLDQLKEKGIPVFADLLFDKYQRGLNGIAHLLERIDFFLPSSYDALSLTGTGSVEECAAFLRKMGPGTVIIKCGAKGVSRRDAKVCRRFPCGDHQRISCPGGLPESLQGGIAQYPVNGRVRCDTGAGYNLNYNSSLKRRNYCESGIKQLSGPGAAAIEKTAGRAS